MKHIFPHPIGNLRDLGTPRQWLAEFVCVALCAAAVILALFFYKPSTKTNMILKAQIIALQMQADHYRNLAKEIALDLLQHPFAPDVEKKAEPQPAPAGETPPGEPNKDAAAPEKPADK